MKEIVDAIYFRRHFWHKVKLSELSELYISLTLRALGLSLIGIFVPVYLYQQGFSIQDITLAFAGIYALRIFVDPITGKFVSLFGPKHIIRASFPLAVIYIISIIAVGNGLWPLWTLIVAFAVSSSSFMIPFHADFSKVENIKHVGSQLSTMAILEKVAGALGPLAGGLLAARYGFETAVVVALVITILATVPLYASGEVGGHKPYQYKFKLKHYTTLKKDYLTLAGRASTLAVATLIWPLLIMLNVFDDQIYSGLGLIAALGLGSTILTAHMVGRLVDNKKGRELLRYGAWLSALSHLLKPFVTTVSAAIGMNVASESADSLGRLPFMKGYYDNADTYKEGRVAYLVGSLLTVHIVRMTLFASVALFTVFFSDVSALTIATLIASFGTMLLVFEKFSALDE